jgi:ribonuclease BN (tRNA processing enzyme)
VGATNTGPHQTANYLRRGRLAGFVFCIRQSRRLQTSETVLSFSEVAPAKEFEMLPHVQARTFATPHTRDSLAIRLQDTNGAKLVYTSDTGYAPELAEFARTVDLLLMECSFRRNKPMTTHLELADAMNVATLAGPRKVVLTHLYPEWDGIDLEAEAKELWGGEVSAALDGLRLDI